MTELEGVVRSGLRSLADDVATDPPPVLAIFGRAARPRRRSRALLGLAIVGGIALGGAGATATGVLPDSVSELMSHEHLVDPARAHIVATAGTLRLWVAAFDREAGGTCLYVQRIDQYARDLSTRYTGCIAPTSEQAVGSYVMVSPDRTVAGRATDQTRFVTFTFADGSLARFAVSDGWFVRALPEWSKPIRSVTALDAEGRTIAGPWTIARMEPDPRD